MAQICVARLTRHTPLHPPRSAGQRRAIASGRYGPRQHELREMNFPLLVTRRPTTLAVHSLVRRIFVTAALSLCLCTGVITAAGIDEAPQSTPPESTAETERSAGSPDAPAAAEATPAADTSDDPTE